LEIYLAKRQNRPPVRTLANAGKTAQICFQTVPRKGYGQELVNILIAGWVARNKDIYLTKPFDFASHSAL
jgi:DNA-binding winged helix-turn-helix (wHTH) protein